MLSLKQQFPNNPLFSQMNSEDFDISQEEFVDMCKLILTGNMSETLSNAFNFMQENQELNNENKGATDIEGGIPVNDNETLNSDEENGNDEIEG